MEHRLHVMKPARTCRTISAMSLDISRVKLFLGTLSTKLLTAALSQSRIGKQQQENLLGIWHMRTVLTQPKAKAVLTIFTTRLFTLVRLTRTRLFITTTITKPT